jgi:hypothetical protein
MVGKTIGVMTERRQTYRQITRALCSSGSHVVVLGPGIEEAPLAAPRLLDLLIVDCEKSDYHQLEREIHQLKALQLLPPAIFLSISESYSPILELFQRFEAINIIPKHDAPRASYPLLDERELIVTCEKILRSDLFGIHKYIQSWGVVLEEDTVTSMAGRYAVLDRFEHFLCELDCPPRIIPSIITVADELITNAILHAPCFPDGRPKYEEHQPRSTVTLDESEYVSIRYGCDGKRLMLSVVDRFGRMDKQALFRYVFRALSPDTIRLETKNSGAGIGLTMTIPNLHQLIFNICHGVCTEAIAGWYIRLDSVPEFLRVGKSFNLFWQSNDDAPPALDS